MSAFMVPTSHIDWLLSAGLSRSILRLPGSSLSWFVSDPDASTYEAGVAIPEAAVEWAKRERRELTRDAAGRVGAMLLAENRRSVDFRYEEEDIEAAYLFREVVGPFPAAAVLKALDCFEYQSCEHPGWPGSEARRFCKALQSRAIGALPGYEAAPWVVEDVHHLGGTSIFDRRGLI